jgi:RNA polymerase sigma factor FliA
VRNPLTAYSLQPESAEALIQQYGHLIDRVARRLAARVGSPSLAQELWSAGASGLLDAAKRFDGNREVKFESFAEHRIRGSMLDELRRMDHLPRRLRSATDAVSKARRKLAQTLSREPTDVELAEATGMQLEELAALDGLAQPHLSFSPEMLLSSTEPLPDEVAQRRQLQSRLAAAIGVLPSRLQMVLSLHYVEGLSYREISGMLDISEPRVCQLHSEAVKKLRAQMGKDGDAAP